MTQPKLSVVMPTIESRKLLTARTLQALRFQQCGCGVFEVIVVDNGCEDATVEALLSLRLPYKLRVPSARGESGPPSIARARNIGIQEATGEIILFLDCDMIAHPSLMSAHLGHHTDDDLVVLGRRYRATPRTTYPSFEGECARDFEAWLAQDEWEADDRAHLWQKQAERGPELRADWAWLYTHNVSIRRDRLLEAGGFDADCGIEDVELGYRLYRRGLRFVLAREAVGFHQFHERSLETWLIRFKGLRLIERKHPELRYWCEDREREWRALAPPAVLEKLDTTLDA